MKASGLDRAAASKLRDYPLNFRRQRTVRLIAIPLPLAELCLLLIRDGQHLALAHERAETLAEVWLAS